MGRALACSVEQLSFPCPGVAHEQRLCDLAAWRDKAHIAGCRSQRARWTCGEWLDARGGWPPDGGATADYSRRLVDSKRPLGQRGSGRGLEPCWRSGGGESGRLRRTRCGARRPAAGVAEAVAHRAAKLGH